MPLGKYDAAFGGGSGSAASARSAMRNQYGSDKGDRVFYASVNKRKKKRGRHKMTARKQGEALHPKGA